MTIAECRCTASWLERGQARTGGLACGRCGLPWIRGGRQLILDDETAARFARFLDDGGEIVYLPRLPKPVYIAPGEVVAPPGKGWLGRCGDCEEGTSAGVPCEYCGGTGWLAYHACVRCGDEGGWEYGPDRLSMSCARCGAQWGVGDPRWLAQRIPARLLPARNAG